ncbi:MAG: glycosyltransferase family 1 protein, partial [Acidobacteriaceae bacterium]|nr:glycosyltransferase family 1 protein [Acidobacteriaceae bacterium]
MSRFARDRRVFFLEEPVVEEGKPHLRQSVCQKTGVRVHTPVVPPQFGQEQIAEYQRASFESLLAQNNISDYIAWYYTPMALEFSSDSRPSLTVYDCMDELSAFSAAPPRMRNNEQLLFTRADLVFTGGASLFESKRTQHPSVH